MNDYSDMLSLSQVRRLLPAGPNGKRPNIETIRRWSIRGLRDGQRLESIRVGGRRYVSPKALVDFIEGDGLGRSVRLRGRDRDRRLRKATQALRVAGIL